jgi:hypothetical protein
MAWSRRAGQIHAEIKQQDLGRFRRRERDRAFSRETSAITRGQNHVVQGHLSLHDVEPGSAPLREFVHHMLPGIEQSQSK